MSTSSSLWNTTVSVADAPCVVSAGVVQVSIKMNDGDWFVGVFRDGEERVPGIERGCDAFPEGTEWRRIGSVADLPELRVAPAFPDRAVVVRPEVPFSVLPGERVQFYVGVPVSIRLMGPSSLSLLQVPSLVLSNTWFGLPTDGELAYALRTRARRDAEELDLDPLRIICPVRVKNQAKELLNFERICIRPQFLSLYEDTVHGLWANESSMIVRSDQEASRVAYARNSPTNLKNPKLWQHGEEEASGTHLLRALSTGKGFFNE